MNTKVTRDKYKSVKALLDADISVERVAKLYFLSPDTVYRIRRADSYRGVNGYFKTAPKNKYDNVMTDYIEMPVRPWWRRLARGKR
jgi:hypothetical protein